MQLVPCAALALFIHPSTSHNLVNRIFWAFCVYLEAVSVLPQLRVMQNTKIVEPFTAHYVFALGVARFLSCAHWVLQLAAFYVNISNSAWRGNLCFRQSRTLAGSPGLRIVALHGLDGNE
ncbi:hypothetical protein GOBAR_DD00303 [Gossypium barbadense]|nr:hypothetical protein GOBAR_DD00303 [Gossypium barbadense]